MNKIIHYNGINFTIEHFVEQGVIKARVGQVGENNVFADGVDISRDGFGYLIEDGREVTAQQLVEEVTAYYFEVLDGQING